MCAAILCIQAHVTSFMHRLNIQGESWVNHFGQVVSDLRLLTL